MDEQESEGKKIEELCRKENHFRRDYNGILYCAVNYIKCNSYDSDNKVKVELPSFGFGNTKKHHTYHLCKRLD